jgi:hypothetical protein
LKATIGINYVESSGSELKQVQTVTPRTDTAEELQAMQALIQRWAMNGWAVKNISQFSHSEGQLGELGMQHSSYSTILFEKEDTSFCPICNVNVNAMNRHRQWHANRESNRSKAGS